MARLLERAFSTGGRAVAGRAAAAAAFLVIALGASVALADEFEDVIQRGLLQYSAGKFVAAASSFGVAAFMSVNDAGRHLACLARLAVAQDSAGQAAARDLTLRQFMDDERLVGEFRASTLEPDLRDRFKSVALTHLARDRILSVETLAAELGLIPARPTRRPTPSPTASPEPSEGAAPPASVTAALAAGSPTPVSTATVASAQAPAPEPPTRTPPFTPTAAATPTPMPPPPTARPTETASSTPTSIPTRTPSATPVPPTATATPSPSSTATHTASRTPSATPLSPTATWTRTPSSTPTESATPTASATPLSPTATRTRTPSFTPTDTATRTASATHTPSFTATLTATRTSTPSFTPTDTATRTFSATPIPPTATRTRTPSFTPTETATRTFPPTPGTPTATVTRTKPSTALSRYPTAVDRYPTAARPAVTPGVDIPRPRPIERVMPIYPKQALNDRVRGVVVLSVLVSESGQPIEVTVKTAARKDLTDAAIAAAKQWRFEPARRKGVAVKGYAEIQFPFEGVQFARTPFPGRFPE